MDVIVVGVDGSPESLAALRYALHQARESGATVRLVNAWHVPAFAYQAAVPPANLSSDLRDEAAATLETALAAAAEELDGVPVQRAVREGEPGHVLVEESADALHLVVGSRGHGGLGEAVLGSVSRYCCRHAQCPVTVIPHRAVVAHA